MSINDLFKKDIILLDGKAQGDQIEAIMDSKDFFLTLRNDAMKTKRWSSNYWDEMDKEEISLRLGEANELLEESKFRLSLNMGSEINEKVLNDMFKSDSFHAAIVFVFQCEKRFSDDSLIMMESKELTHLLGVTKNILELFGVAGEIVGALNDCIYLVALRKSLSLIEGKANEEEYNAFSDECELIMAHNQRRINFWVEMVYLAKRKTISNIYLLLGGAS